MQREIKALEEFQQVFNLTYNSTPTVLDWDTANLRFKLIEEENQEYFDGVMDGNKVEILDALVDILYITFGTAVCHGMQDLLVEAFWRVHENNMAKLDANGKPVINGENGVFDETRPLGKVLKPEGWKPVDLSDLF